MVKVDHFNYAHSLDGPALSFLKDRCSLVGFTQADPEDITGGNLSDFFF